MTLFFMSCHVFFHLSKDVTAFAGCFLVDFSYGAVVEGFGSNHNSESLVQILIGEGPFEMGPICPLIKDEFINL